MIKLKRKQIALEPIYDSDYHNASTKLIKIPDSAKERCDQGIIKYIGKDCDPMFEVGKIALFSGYSGTTIGIDGEILIVIHSDFLKCQVDIEHMEVPGLFFRSVKDKSAIADHNRYEYFPATYEDAVRLLAKAYNEQYSSRLDVKKEEYKEQRDEIDERSR